jgi:hypothetical protein
MQLHLIKPDLYSIILGVLRQLPIMRKQRYLPGAPTIFIESLDYPAPGFMLAVIQLAQIQHLSLHHPAASAAPVLDNAPIAVRLAVLNSPGESQEHVADSTAKPPAEKALGLHYTRFQAFAPCIDSAFCFKIPKSGAQLRKSG